MEQNLPIVAKKFWHVVRVAYSVLRKRISKAKLLADLKIYMMMKRGKIGGGAGGRAAVFKLVLHHHQHHRSGHENQKFSLDERENFRQHFDGELMAAAAAMEMVNSASASPAVRQLRIMESPLTLMDMEEDSHVDEAAEEFINKFYNELRQQNSDM